jgi:hypothetical protein
VGGSLTSSASAAADAISEMPANATGAKFISRPIMFFP